jgi:tRNA C32,U32 (ribose-2'-O)-methylase TrmJ
MIFNILIFGISISNAVIIVMFYYLIKNQKVIIKNQNMSIVQRSYQREHDDKIVSIFEDMNVSLKKISFRKHIDERPRYYN